MFLYKIHVYLCAIHKSDSNCLIKEMKIKINSKKKKNKKHLIQSILVDRDAVHF